jgi:Fe-S oxidoreductase
MTKIPDIEEDVLACIQCGYCNSVCPTYAEFKWESASPRGKIYFLKRYFSLNIIEKLFNKKEEYKRGFVKSLYICAGCGACNKICPVEIPLSYRWEQLKDWLVHEGIAPMDRHKPLLERVTRYRNPFNEPVKDRILWAGDDLKLKSKPEILYFVGCTESYRRQEIAQATLKILNKMEARYTLMGVNEQCCGSPLLRTGQSDIVREELAPQNIANIEKTGVETVVTACSGCFQTLKNDYPRITGKLPFELLHISQYLDRQIQEGNLEFKNEIKRTVTYHDPCHLGRHSDVFDEPRNVMAQIPGVELMEMPRIRMASRCCGAGGGFKIAFNDSATTIGFKRVKEANATGAEIIITTCPFCKTNLNDGATKVEGGLKTYDLVELALEAL